ncbi:hypothetical protein JCM24511_06820 [Saitozyma sp. JCM 24511]|nr:hypothetical protein JCM24511_06820 [Saitozyma sp. JCM 24511]
MNGQHNSTIDYHDYYDYHDYHNYHDNGHYPNYHHWVDRTSQAPNACAIPNTAHLTLPQASLGIA